ncbi:MAG TPA: flagellar protein FliT [Burkholderiales bacterium]|nr:flagellar protein FliT [Burkholderiales bacterium]
MTDAETIACYERVLAIMEEMHVAARNAEWDRLVALERDCKAVVTRLAAEEPRAPVGSALQPRKGRIIRQVLMLDAAIRDITEPRLKELQALLGTRQQQRKLHQAYGASDAA